jgi:PPP family 3-phenylpropionic acid transporter
LSEAARLRLFYFLYYAGVGVTLPYFSVYLRGLGLSGTELGAVQVVGPLLAAPAGMLWAAAADRLRAANRALILATVGVALAYALLPLVQRALSVGAVLAMVGLFGAATVPLIDSLAVEWGVGRSGHSYGRIRLHGSLGYIVAAQGVGLLLAARGDRPGDPVVPVALAFLAALGAAVAFTLPRVTPPPHPARLDEALRLLRHPPLLLLIAVCALHWLSGVPYNLLFGLFAREHGLPSSVVGLASGLGVLAEVAVLWFGPPLERRFRVRTLLAVAFGLTALRWGLLAQAQSGAFIVLLQVLHGATFGLFWATAVRALGVRVPAALRVSGQALFSAVVFQLGNALGNGLSGAGLDHFGRVAPLFSCAAVLELLPLLLLWSIHD